MVSLEGLLVRRARPPPLVWWLVPVRSHVHLCDSPHERCVPARSCVLQPALFLRQSPHRVQQVFSPVLSAGR